MEACNWVCASETYLKKGQLVRLRPGRAVGDVLTYTWVGGLGFIL